MLYLGRMVRDGEPHMYLYELKFDFQFILMPTFVNYIALQVHSMHFVCSHGKFKLSPHLYLYKFTHFFHVSDG